MSPAADLTIPFDGDVVDDPGFADLAELAALACDMPVAGVYVVQDGARLGAWHGLVPQVPLERTPCADVLASGELVEIADLSVDPRWDEARALRDLAAYAGAPIRDRDGTVTGVVCVAAQAPRRLTAAQLRALVAIAKRAEAELERRAEQIRRDDERRTVTSVISAVPDGILLESEDRHVLVANQAFCDMLGFRERPAAIVGARSEELLRPAMPQFADPEGFVRRVREVWDEGVSVYGEELQLFDGRVLVRDYIPVDHDGERAHLWHFRDVSAARVTEERLGDSENRFAALSEVSSGAIFGFDAAGEVTIFSPALRRFVPRDRPAGWTPSDAFPAEEREALRRRYARAIRGESPMRFEHGLLDADGRRREVAVSVMPVKVVDGVVERWIGTITDITDKVRAAEALIESERERERERERRVRLERAARIAAEQARAELAARHDELTRLHEYRDTLLASVSHELRTPLTAIGTFSALLGESSELAAGDRELLGVIARNAARLESLVEDLLLLKGGTDDLRLTPNALDLEQLVRESFTTLRPQATAEEIDLVLVPGGARARAFATASRVGQIIDNVVANAIKHTPAGGTVSARVSDAGAMVRLEVTDTGRGIPAAELPLVFDGFFQGEAGRARGTGSGLGLTIVKLLAERQGGSATVASTEDVGTTVTIELPRAEAAS